MATRADYIALRDTEFTLGEDQEMTLEFELPSDYTPGEGDARPILAYIVDPSSDAAMEYEIDVNDQQIQSLTLGNAVRRGFWEVFEGTTLTNTAKNTIQFRVERGVSATFSDVVLWYQRTTA
jgi:hypothetical protein